MTFPSWPAWRGSYFSSCKDVTLPDGIYFDPQEKYTGK
jgi:hypothetical protein